MQTFVCLRGGLTQGNYGISQNHQCPDWQVGGRAFRWPPAQRIRVDCGNVHRGIQVNVVEAIYRVKAIAFLAVKIVVRLRLLARASQWGDRQSSFERPEQVQRKGTLRWSRARLGRLREGRTRLQILCSHGSRESRF